MAAKTKVGQMFGALRRGVKALDSDANELASSCDRNDVPISEEKRLENVHSISENEEESERNVNNNKGSAHAQNKDGSAHTADISPKLIQKVSHKIVKPKDKSKSGKDKGKALKTNDCDQR